MARIVTDITVHKQVEELRIRLLQIEEERNHLRSALLAFEQLLGVVGHELRTPLAAVRATAELLLDDEAQDAAASNVFVKNIHGEVVRMAHLVDDLVEVARLNSGVARWNWSEFGVGQICEEALSTLSLIISQDKVGLVLKVDPTDLVMRGDSGAIRRLVVNLLNNAYKHTPEGSISVLASNLSIGGLDWIQIVVSDTGHGMSPEVAARLGEAFALNSGVVGESHVQGSGLGLAICRGIDIAFTPSVKAVQERMGSRKGYSSMEQQGGWNNRVTPELARFIDERDTMFIATTNAEGQPYIQHRGGPPGFLKVLNEHTLGFADFSGNRQYITVGNLEDNPKAFIFLMDFANRRRIKIWGRAEVVDNDDELKERLYDPDYGSAPERMFLFHIDAWDVNCPKHITPRFTEEEVGESIQALCERIAQLEAEVRSCEP